jgi:hypothetical protein
MVGLARTPGRFGGASGSFAGFDRFGRVVDQVWQQYDHHGDATAEPDHFRN